MSWVWTTRIKEEQERLPWLWIKPFIKEKLAMLCQCWTWCYESAIFPWEKKVHRIINKAGRVFCNLGGWIKERWRTGTLGDYGGVATLLLLCKSRVVLHYERGGAPFTVLTGLSLGEADVQLWLAEAELSAESSHNLSNWERWAQHPVCIYIWRDLGADKEAQLAPIRKVLPLSSSFCHSNTFSCGPDSCNGQFSPRKGAQGYPGVKAELLAHSGLDGMGICTSKCVNIFCPGYLQLTGRLSDWRTGMWTLFEIYVHLSTGGMLQGLLSIPNGLGRIFKFYHLYRDLIVQYVLKKCLPCVQSSLF